MRIAYDVAPLMNPRTGVGHYAGALLDHLRLLDPALSFNLYALTRNSNIDAIPGGKNSTLIHRHLPARVVRPVWEMAGFPAGEWLTGNVDVTHGTCFWFPAVRKSRGVVTIHDLTFALYPELCEAQALSYRWIVPRVLKRTSMVITPSETVRSQVHEELGFPIDRIVATPEGIRSAFLGAKPDIELERRLEIPRPYVLFAGTQEPRKNLDRLIQAIALAPPDVTLVIAGPPGWGSVDLPALAHHLHLDSRVRFSGYLADSDLGSLIAGCRAFMFPTLYEGFGLPPLEAMAAGVPVVSSDAGSLPEVLGDAPFYCDPLDVDSIASALTSAVTDEPARAVAIAEGKKVASKYSWEQTARLTLETYRRAIG